MAANALATIRNAILTSLHGRRLGLLNNEWLGGQRGMVNAITVATSDTTGTNLPNYGIVEVVTSTDDTWVLDDPIAGGTVTIRTGSSSTGVHTVNANNAKFQSSDSSTGGSITLVGGAAAVTLYGASTAIWSPVSITLKTTVASSAGVHIST